MKNQVIVSRCEPDQPKYFDYEPTIDEPNDGNDMMKDPEDEAARSNLENESSDEEPGHREPGHLKDFDHEPTIDEPNDGNDMRDGAMKDAEDEAAPSNLERNGKKNKKISVKLPDAGPHSQPQPVRKVSRKKCFRLFSPTTDMNKLLDLTVERATRKPRNKEDKGDREKKQSFPETKIAQKKVVIKKKMQLKLSPKYY